MPAGFDSCSGCGRQFWKNNPAEQVVLDMHDCSWSDEQLDQAIADATRKRSVVQGYRRTPEMTQALVNAIQDALTAYPTLRFGQLLVNAVGSHDLFFNTFDEYILETLDAYTSLTHRRQP